MWGRLQRAESLSPLLERLLFVEQPLHRDVALGEAVRAALLAWSDRPPIIIDESDGGLGDLPTALEGGYSGTSHKNCKGVIKGIANACLLEHRRPLHPDRRCIMSGEDLSNVGPVALPQDLAAVACLGIGHVERNGHHYFAGLSMYPEPLQDRIAAAHPDLYRRHPRGFVTLDIQEGRVAIGSVLDAPFGYGFEFDPSVFTPADAWPFASLGLGEG